MDIQVKGNADVLALIARIEADQNPDTFKPFLRAGAEYYRDALLEMTARGVDIYGRPFDPYSTKPYTWYPNGYASEGGRPSSYLPNYARAKRTFKRLSINKGAADAPRLDGQGIYFPGGYAQFKASLGRSAVDLRGPRAPGLLQSMTVAQRGDDYVIGFIGQKDGGLTHALLAQFHIEGASSKKTGKKILPSRIFFGITEELENKALKLISDLYLKHLDKRLKRL